MRKGTKYAVAAISEIFIITTLLAISQVDTVVNGTLYYFGLTYSYEWFFPYKLFSTVEAVFIGVLAILVPFTVASDIDDVEAKSASITIQQPPEELMKAIETIKRGAQDSTEKLNKFILQMKDELSKYSTWNQEDIVALMERIFQELS